MKNTRCLREFIKYSSLNVLGMMGISCYILADTFFVSKGLGSRGLAALNLAIPVYSFISGAALMLGMGGATKYSIKKSRGEDNEANLIFSQTMLLGGLFSAAFFTLGLFFTSHIARLLGADDAVYEMCRIYLQVVLLFAPMFMLNSILLCFVRNDGAPGLSMMAMIGGSLANIVLDYIFIFPLDMGIFGAVLATGFAPVIGMLIMSPHFISGKNGFRFEKHPISSKVGGEIAACGLPSLIGELSSGVVIIIFNLIILGLEGNMGVAAYGVVANISLVVLAVYTGVAQGIQPIISRSFGSGDLRVVKSTLRYALLSVLIISAILYCGILFGAGTIARIFNSEGDTLLQAIAVSGLKIYFIACLFAGFNIVLCVYFTSCELTRPAHIISLLRGFLIIIPAAFLLSSLFGMTGVWCAFPVAELTVSLIGAALYFKAIRDPYMT